jgi:hypothetical protein
VDGEVRKLCLSWVGSAPGAASILLVLLKINICLLLEAPHLSPAKAWDRRVETL